MNRAASRGIEAVAFVKITSAIACLSLTLLSPQSAQADLTGAPMFKANWVQPLQKRIFTAADAKVQAKLIVKRHIFDEGQPHTSGKLSIKRNGVAAGSDSYVSQKDVADIVNISGPVLAAIGDQDEPAVEVQKQCYQEIYHYEYAWNDQNNHYDRRDPSVDAADSSVQKQLIKGYCSDSSDFTKATLQWQQKIYEHGGANWKLQIKKGKKIVYSGVVEPPLGEGGDGRVDKTPECFGPFVTAKIDPKGEIMTDLRVTRVVGSARLAAEMIYYYDRPSHKIKVATHEWGLNYPRLADLWGDKQIEFVTEDWSLSKPDMGGPIQIWRWGNTNNLRDVTTQFPLEIKHHATAALAQWKKDHSRANLLAYVGDLCLLKRTKTAIEELNKLNNATETNEKIIAQLKKAGYLTSADF